MLDQARDRGLDLTNFHCLALERVLADETLALDQKPPLFEALRFPDDCSAIVCTAGPLADCLMGRLRSGAKSLSDALGYWLIPRHATHFGNAVRGGKIVLWLRVTYADDERRACQWLLSCSSSSVGVHDLLLPRE
jgi:hypothetical protein